MPQKREEAALSPKGHGKATVFSCNSVREDGMTAEFRTFCAEMGVQYCQRQKTCNLKGKYNSIISFS